ncbi:MAG: UvrD-helicase domain-containing protein [Candidatus Amoebophilus sp.]
MSKLYIYRSAAGSGKTYVLVKAYLQLSLRAPLYFQRILAVTFTNRATQEMKQRILNSLHDIAQGKESLLNQELNQASGWDSEELQKRAQAVLSKVLHNYDHFSVSTIDSFLQSIVRNFSKELGIQHGFTIEMDQETILDYIIDDVINTANQDKQLHQWLVNFAENKLLAGKSWHFKQALKQLGYELFTENFGQQERLLIEATNNKHKLTTFLAELETGRLKFENSLQKLGKEAMHQIQISGLEVSDFSYGQRGIAGYLMGVSEKKNFTPTQRALTALESIEAWYSKTSPKKLSIVSLVQNSLQDILKKIISYYQAEHHIYHTTLAVQQFIYAFGIITHLLASLRNLRAEKNIMLISDAANLLRQIIAENDTPFVYEKVGSFYNHFLLDEFQDISDFQWQNLKPLISNGLATGHMSLLVGDAKQSIYRWRGSKWQLLSTKLEKEFTATKSLVLEHNWRSKPSIVHFNNTFFTQASKNLASHLQQEINQLEDNSTLKQQLSVHLQAISSVYAHAYQHIPAPVQSSQDQGYVEVNFLCEADLQEEKSSWKEQIKQRLPALLEELQKDGFRLQDIALLVRSHAEGRELSQSLLSYQHSEHAKPGYKYSAISAESLYLGQSPWINIIISALKYLENEIDILARTELVYLYQIYVCKKEQGVSHELFQQNRVGDDHNLLPTEFISEFYRLTKLPLYERIVKLVSIFQLNTTASKPFIYTFQDIVLTYLQQNPAEHYNFLKWWEEKGNKHALPHMEGEDAIHIMTIHQAKGLQFKVVIVPFCAWNLDHNTYKPPIIWCSTDKAPFSTFPSLPLRYHKGLQETVYAQAYYEERMQVYLDHFNLLYVALTRAEERLYIFAQQPEKAKLDTTADLLYQTISGPPLKFNDKEDSNKYFLKWEHYWQEDNQKLVIGNPITSNQQQ